MIAVIKALHQSLNPADGRWGWGVRHDDVFVVFEAQSLNGFDAPLQARDAVIDRGDDADFGLHGAARIVQNFVRRDKGRGCYRPRYPGLRAFARQMPGIGRLVSLLALVYFGQENGPRFSQDFKRQPYVPKFLRSDQACFAAWRWRLYGAKGNLACPTKVCK
jgi:hypothetical protein